MLAQSFNPEMKRFPKGIKTVIQFVQKLTHSFNKHLLIAHHALGCSHWLSRSPRGHTEDLAEEITPLGAFEGIEQTATEGERGQKSAMMHSHHSQNREGQAWPPIKRWTREPDPTLHGKAFKGELNEPLQMHTYTCRHAYNCTPQPTQWPPWGLYTAEQEHSIRSGHQGSPRAAHSDRSPGPSRGQQG